MLLKYFLSQRLRRFELWEIYLDYSTPKVESAGNDVQDIIPDQSLGKVLRAFHQHFHIVLAEAMIFTGDEFIDDTR